MFSLAQNYLTRGFWGDEAWTSLISQLPYLQMLKTTAADFHPPAYYTIVEIVYKFLPPTEIVTRSISIFFYLLTILLVWKMASEIKGRLFGVLSAIVVAVNPIFFTYAFEARNYTMFAFAATGSIYFLIRISENFTKLRALGFVIFSTLGIYTHYYMFFILAAQGFYLILFDRKILLKVNGLYIVVAILYLPWLPFLLGQVKSVGQNYWIGTIDKRTHFEAMLRILGGEYKNIFRPFLFWLSTALIIIGLVQHALRHPSTSSGPRFEKPYLLIWLWAIAPFILASLPGLVIDGFKLPFRPIFFWRYLIGAAVPLAMVMVHTSEKLPKYLFTISIAAIIILSITIDALTFSRYPYTFRQAYQQEILPEITASDKIVTVLPSFAEVAYYRQRFGIKNDLIVLPEGLVQFSGKSLLDVYEDPPQISIRNLGTPEDIEAIFKGVVYWELRPGPIIEIK